jgi:RNA polymerase sigma-70 factor (ECF subfamily)
MNARPHLPLCGILREHGLDVAPADEAAVEASLGRLFEEGERAWPGLGLPAEAFVHHLASRRSDGAAASTPERLARVRAADLYLACACAARLRGAVEAFDRALLSRMDAFLSRMRPSPAFVDEVRQALREKLFVGRDGAPPKIGEYDGQGALESWVRVIALRAAIDLKRQGGATAAAPEGAKEPHTSLDPEIGYLKRRYRRAFSAAFRGAVAALDPDDRELLRLRFVEGLTQAEVAARLGVHRATVVRRLDAAQQAVNDGARRLLQAELRATESELASLEGLMRSQIEMSLPGLLKGA